MTLIEYGKRGLAVLTLAVGVGATAPSSADDWRALRPIDLPAALVRATWSDGSYLGEDHPIQFGRMIVYMEPSDATRKISVKVAKNGGEGIVVDNLTCYNVLMGQSLCTLQLNPPKYCHLYFDLKTKIPDSEHFELQCPADLQLAN